VAHKRPACDSMIDRLIDKAIPVPWGFVVKNASKTLSARSGGNPIPLSTTEIGGRRCQASLRIADFADYDRPRNAGPAILFARQAWRFSLSQMSRSYPAEIVPDVSNKDGLPEPSPAHVLSEGVPGRLTNFDQLV
jgi:hypothetical protein